MEKSPKLRRWHEFFAFLLELTLTQKEIAVQANVDVSSAPPEIDIVLMQNLNDKPTWTAAQLTCLPDGIRQSSSRYILLEFKYTESITVEAVKTLGGYETFFRRSRGLKADDVQSFLVSAHQPLRETRETLCYTERLQPGVYANTSIFFARTRLIVLSELSDAPHNVFFKLFAHQRQAKKAALANFEQHHRVEFGADVEALILSLLELWALTGVAEMRAITKEDLLKRGRELPQQVLALMTDEELADVLRNKPFVQRLQQQSLEQGLEKGLEQGREEGLEQGLEKGLERGREQGLVEGLHKAIELGLELKFGAAGLELLPEIHQITQVALLEVLQEALKTALTPAAIRHLYQPQE